MKMLDKRPPATMMPLEILADAKVEAATGKDDKRHNNNKTHKTKTILNWLKNTNTSSNSSATGTATTKTLSQYKHNNNRNSTASDTSQYHKQLATLAKEQKHEAHIDWQRLAEREERACASTPPRATAVCFVGAEGREEDDAKAAAAAIDDDKCTCSLLQQQNNTHHNNHNNNPTVKSLITNSDTPRTITTHSDETLREFRGVQTLKHFWNKRITANKESALKAKSSKHQHPQQLFTKSQSCLLVATTTSPNQTGEPPPTAVQAEALGSTKLRAQSLHDCSQDFEDLTVLSDLEIQKHLEKDNFYKYKTAEQASKLRELSEHSSSRRFSAGIFLPWVQGYHKGERWFRRPEIFSKRKLGSPIKSLSKSVDLCSTNDNDNNSDMASMSDIVINDMTTLPRAKSQNVHIAPVETHSDTESSPTLTAANSTRHHSHPPQGKLISPQQRSRRRHDSLKVSDSAAVSRNSSSTSLANSGSSNRNGSVKRNSSSAARKYSFKTHARSYHAPRRMHSQRENSAATTNHHHPSASSMVAKLTQQFNEMLQQDKTLLQEVKRKNGVLMTHKGHVYKLVETAKAPASRTSSRNFNSQENDSREDISNSSCVSVQKTIKKFETVTRNSAKPKVPSKSLKVLKKSSELVINKAGKVVYPPKAVLTNGYAKRETDGKLPPQSLMLPSTLEMVKEEAKTPVTEGTKVEDGERDTRREEIRPKEITIENPTKLQEIEEGQFNCSGIEMKQRCNRDSDNGEITQETPKDSKASNKETIQQEQEECYNTSHRNGDAHKSQMSKMNFPREDNATKSSESSDNETYGISQNFTPCKEISNETESTPESYSPRQQSPSRLNSSTPQTESQIDAFFEEIFKAPKQTEDSDFGYKTISRKAKVTRKSSTVVDDPRKEIVIYINESAENRLSKSFEPTEKRSTLESSTGAATIKVKTPEQIKTKDYPFFKPGPNKTNLAKEFTRELNEKLCTLPRTTYAHDCDDDVDSQVVTKVFLLEERKANDKICTEAEGKVIVKPTSNSSSKQEEIAKLTLEFKNKTNNGKLVTPPDKEETYAINSTSPETKKTKTKSKFYEKIKFFTMSRKQQKLQQISTPTSSETSFSTSTITIESEKTESSQSEINKTEEDSPTAPSDPLPNYTPMSSPLPQQRGASELLYASMYDPESKLLDALQQVDEKLQNLKPKTDEPISPKLSEKVAECDDYGHHIKPNTSFLHQGYAKDLPKPAQLIQAVNVTLVNAIEGEQMIMEQKEIQQAATSNEREDTVHTCTDKEDPGKSYANIEDEPLYEPIGCCNIDEQPIESPLKTAPSSATIQTQEEDDDIYQTVEEVQKAYALQESRKSPMPATVPPPPVPPIPPSLTIPSIPPSLPTSPIPVQQHLLDDYEIIEDPDAKPLTLNCHLQTPKTLHHFDGYEECSPTPLDGTALTSSTAYSTTPVVRKTTDELPDLPKPKRVLPKSPMPMRPTPKLPCTKPAPASAAECPETQPLPCSGESHYYTGEEENIYDTIKGSHCYESLQSVGNKLQKSSSASTKNSDCVSLTSNCYESITHYKSVRAISHHSSSSHGSTLTISSENKTNSLYEDSLGSSLHYFSKIMSGVEGRIEIQQSLRKTARSATYNSSNGRTSDTSDEWTDVTDNEQGDGEGEEQKPQFIIVRSKAHKSPDWSRRVRDKRLHHERKTRSYIEDDDPDHYYEQLSPSALTKRHSLALQERSGSLQRNQQAVRVSKRGKQISYSAHALGQEISDDSFDFDTDDYYESEHFKHSHNDSGVDIRTSKLPDPPSSSNQMYAFVKKFKNFIGGNKKSPNSSKHGGSQQKIDDNASQFYVNGNFYTSGGPGSGAAPVKSLQVPQTKELSTSEKNLILAQSNITKAEQLSTSTTPRKPKSGKSLRSRLRKSLVGFDNKQLQTLTPTRSTFYVEEPCHPADDTNGQLDSGFSEKASSGDIPVNTNTSTPTSSSIADTHKFTTLARKSKKEAKTNNTHRRRTTIGIRPIEPPPPPPDSNGGGGAGAGITGAKRQSNTSWYAECGVFKNGSTNLVSDDAQLLNGQNASGTMTSGASWYEEAGLYQTSGVSVASSSGSSGVSTSNEAGPPDEMSHSLFSNEPLYQIYSAAKLEAISRDMHDESSTDGYEEVGERRRSLMIGGGSHRKSARQTALELVEKERGPARTLWSQIPEVVNSMIIPTLTPRERALMEAKFEIITSEASYLKSLNLLRNHFMNHPVFRDQNLVNSRDRKALFAHIVPVHDCCERLLTELESCWQDNIMLIGLSKRIYAIAEKHFHVYVTFCEQQGRMDRTLKRLRATKGIFSQNLELLEANDACCSLNLHSFLMLPMQRITRLPLLIDAVFSKCDPNDDEYDNWKMCLAIINKIVTQCNEAATKSDQVYEIEKISGQLEFNPSVIRPLAIAPVGVLAPGTKPRYLVKKGEFTHIIWRGDDAKLTFGKKFTKTSIYAFLFSDLLVLTKRKGEEQFSVFDYCPRNMLTITSGDTLPQLPTKDLNSQTSKNLILMTLLENHERKTNELVLSCPSVSEQERWLQAMRPPESETPGEKLYEQWDCPQVMAKHAYENNEPDGLSLEVGDVINVTRKLPDGWYQGERIRDGAVGWFPESYTEEVNSAHVRARNLKLRHRLLTFTATYLESQKRNK